MHSTTLNTFALLSLLIFCSCSNPSDTAQVPDVAPVIPQTTRLKNTAVQQFDQRPKKTPQPADILLQQKDLFGPLHQEFAGDSFLETQASFEEVEAGEIPTAHQTDFSQGLLLDTN